MINTLEPLQWTGEIRSQGDRHLTSILILNRGSPCKPSFFLHYMCFVTRDSGRVSYACHSKSIIIITNLKKGEPGLNLNNLVFSFT